MSGTAAGVAAALAGASAALLVGGPSPPLARAAPSARERSAPPLLPLAAVLAVPVLLLVGLVPLLLAAAGGLLLRQVLAARRRAAADDAERSGALQACAALASELRAGRDPAGALEVAAEAAAGPLAVGLRSAAGAARLGGDVPGALLGGPTSAVPEVARSLAACWTVCATTGAGLAAAVDRLEEGLRGAAEARRSVQAEVAGPRATAGMLALLPAAGLLLAAGLGADPLAVLLGTPLGLVCLTAGLLLDGLGVWWTGRLVARALRTA